ncbi:MAG: nitroreductase family protein [Petrotogales bacterium]
MNGNNLSKKAVIVSLVIIFCSIAISPSLGKSNSPGLEEKSFLVGQENLLPPPQFMDMSLEKSIMRRMSMRNFTDVPVTDEELSTVLWAAYGIRVDGNLTVAEINGSHAAVIYILLEDVYKYNPMNHSLVFYKEGDYRDIGQYSAPVQLGLCWNTDIADANLGSAELGAVGQNIYFAAMAIGLGTVITADRDQPAITPVGIPENEHGMGVMPLGHVVFDYNFKYRPMLFSLLPRIKFSDTELTTALEDRDEVTSWESDSISRKDLSHLIWASYGYSYYLDKSGSNIVKRHHTVPSAHGYYPFRIYAATKNGVFRYMYGLYPIDIWGLPVVSFLLPVGLGDKRSEIAQATELFASDAPLDIIIVLDIGKTNQREDLSDENLRWIWYYEAGAAAHNVLLQAASRGLNGNILAINDKEAICSLLRLNSESFDPMLVVPVG